MPQTTSTSSPQPEQNAAAQKSDASAQSHSSAPSTDPSPAPSPPAAPDASALEAQLAAAQKQGEMYKQLALSAGIAQRATLEAITLGIDVKTVPYVLKMADFSAVQPGKDGTPDPTAIQAAINKVLDDIPILKPKAEDSAAGFKQIGAGSGNAAQSDAIARIFGNKK